MGPFAGGIGLVARVELRQRWRALLGLALLVGLVGTVSLSGFAGARRTASALDRFREETLARDARAIGADDEVTEDLAEALRDAPWVAAAGEFVDFTVSQGPTVISVYAGTDKVFANGVDRPLVLDGRMPAADAADEVAIDEVTRDRLEVEVGDTLSVTGFDPEDLRCLITGSCAFQGLPGPELDLEVVGVMRDVDAFAITEDPTPSVTASAAFTEAYRDEVGAIRSEVAVRLVDPTDLDRLRDLVDEVTDRGTLTTSDDDFASGARDAVDVLGTALLVFAAVSALAGAFAVLQAVTRQVDAAAAATTTLPALGSTRWGWARAVALPSLGAVVVGALVAPVGAYLASDLFPIGFAARIEPDPGRRPDVLVHAGGALLVVLVVGAWALAAGRRWGATGPRRAWTPTLRWAGLTPAAGVRLAFGRGRHRAAGPMRSAMIGIGIGAAGAIGAAFVLVSLDDLVDTPERWGVTWDGTGTVIDPATFDDTLQAIADEDGVVAAATLRQGLIQPEGDEVNAYAVVPVEGDPLPAVRRGRLPEAEDEVALGELTMDQFGLDLDGRLVVQGAADGDETTIEPDVTLRVVGTVVFPPYNDLQPAQGAFFTPEGLSTVNQARSTDALIVEFDEDVDGGELTERIADEHAVGLLGPIIPPQLSNLDEASTVIRALIAFFVALAVVGLVQALAISGRRHRPNFAVWRAVGFVPGQVRRAVRWQSAVITAVGVVTGIPLGLYVGLVAWRLTVQNLGVLDQPTWPIVAVLAALPGALLAAWVLALVPAWLAARGRPAADLHAE